MHRCAVYVLRAAVAASLAVGPLAAQANAMDEKCKKLVTTNRTPNWIWVTVYDFLEWRHLDWGWVAPNKSREWRSGGFG